MTDLAEVRDRLSHLEALVLRVLEQLVARDSARLLKPAECARLTGYGVTQIHQMINRGEIPVVHLGERGQKRVPIVALRALILEKLRDSQVDPELVERMLE